MTLSFEASLGLHLLKAKRLQNLLVLDLCGRHEPAESWRRFVMGSVEPVAELVAAELAGKLDLPGLKFDFSSLWAHDMAGRAQAFKQMATAGMDIAQAAGLSGLMAMGE